MRAMFLILAVCSLTACASNALKEKFMSNVHVGDSKEKALAAVGLPDAVGPSVRMAGAEGYNYYDGSAYCGLTVKEDVVAMITCGQKSSGAGAAALSGFMGGMSSAPQPTSFGQGMQQPAAKPFKQTDQACMSSCQRKGSQYQFCQSQCQF